MTRNSFRKYVQMDDVSVKSLEWVERNPLKYTCDTAVGDFCVFQHVSGAWEFILIDASGEQASEDLFDLESEAKAAAEAAFKDRVLSCLNFSAGEKE